MLLVVLGALTASEALQVPSTWGARRQAIAEVGGMVGGLVLLPANAVEKETSVSVEFAPDVTGTPMAKASFTVPPDWEKLSDTTAAVSGGRRLVVYSSPADSDWNCFLLLTPVRGDYTSLGSFGSLDSVQDTIIPRGEGIESQLIASASSSGRYVYEYTLSVPEQPKRHLKTIFSLMADTIVTFNIQALEDTYTPDIAKISEAILSSLAISKLGA